METTEIVETTETTVSFTAEQEALIAARINNALEQHKLLELQKQQNEQKAKELKEAEINGEFKTLLEAERVKAEQLQQALDKVRREADMKEVIIETKLPQDLKQFLQGSTKSEMLESAKAILKHVKPSVPNFEVNTVTNQTPNNENQYKQQMRATGYYRM